MTMKKATIGHMLLLLGVILGHQVLFAVNDLIMILDPHRQETMEKSDNIGAMVSSLVCALRDKTAPIIVTSNLLEVIVSLQQKIGDKDLQRLRTLMQTTSDQSESMALAQGLLTSHGIDTKIGINIILRIISIIDLDKSNWNCYLHNSANVALLIPKQYIQQNIPTAINSNPKDQAQACGFNPAIITVIDDLSADNLLQKLKLQQAAPIQEEKFVTNLTALIIPDKEERKWVIYLAGHGLPAQTLFDIRGQLERAKKAANNAHKNFPNDPAYAKEIISHNQSEIRRCEKILAKYKSDIMPETAQIAGLPLNDFKRLLRFFDKHMNVAFLHYMTCYGGGSNQALVNRELKKLKVDFIVSAEGINETSIIHSISIDSNSAGPGLITTGQNFSQFFKLLKLYVDKPEEFEKLKGKNKEPLAEILRSVVTHMEPRNQPFVRLPDAGAFEVLALDKKVKSLTKAVVKEYESKKQPIDLSKDTEVEVIIDYPARINVPLDLGAIDHQEIVAPTPRRVSTSFEIIHIFKEIHAQQTMQSFMFHLIHLNARRNKQTFVVKKLTGILCEKSGLPVGKENIIHNLIIQIKGVLGNLQESEGIEGYATPENVEPNVIGANVEVAFELNNVIYQSYFTLPNFTDYTIESFQSFSFTGTPVAKADWKGFAEIFIPVAKVKDISKPITMDAIVKYISDRIDKQ